MINFWCDVDWFSKFFQWWIPKEILSVFVIKMFHMTLSMVLHYLVNYKVKATDLNNMLHTRPRIVLPHMWLPHSPRSESCWLQGVKNSAALIKRSSVLQQTEAGVGCSRLLLTKLLMNGTNICQLMFVSEADILSTWFDFEATCRIDEMDCSSY